MNLQLLKFLLLINGNDKDVDAISQALTGKCNQPEASNQKPYTHQFELTVEENELDTIRNRIREITKDSKNLDDLMSIENSFKKTRTDKARVYKTKTRTWKIIKRIDRKTDGLGS